MFCHHNVFGALALSSSAIVWYYLVPLDARHYDELAKPNSFALSTLVFLVTVILFQVLF